MFRSSSVAVVVVTCLILQCHIQHKAKSQAICTWAGEKKICRHPVPAWHGPSKRFADAALAGLGLQCAKSGLPVSLIAAAISPGLSFTEPCSPQPSPSNFFFCCKACICHPYVPHQRAEEGKGRKSADATFIALLLPAGVPLLSPGLAQPMAAYVQEPRPSGRGGDRCQHHYMAVHPLSCIRKFSKLELFRF